MSMTTAPATDTTTAGFRRSGWGWIAGAVWLFYLGQPLDTILNHPAGVARTVSLVALVAFAVVYVAVFIWMRRFREWQVPLPRPRAAAWLLSLLALGLLTIPAAGGDWMVTLVYVAASTMMLLPPRIGLPIVVLLVLTPLLLPFAVPAWQRETTLAFAIALAAFATFGVARIIEHNSQLVAAQKEIARLAVAEERNRAARDLHDILGHSLTVITVKAELAGRLLPIDPDKAASEVADLERLAREALADIRRTVGAYRETSLENELASAEAALAAAGVEADLPATVDGVPPARRELFGWAVREGVTNVVRHSGATRCTIRILPDRVEIVDNGRGPDADDGRGQVAAPHGNGLRGLRERAEQVGAALTVGRATAGSGFMLRVSVPS
jgi:two-component system sensor histidine kinase DesK